ncbi:iron-containing alcohol dehydrogenase [Rhodobacterales bacterium HKCCE2091]|nr:iron-containing alcohol dehydrogenase [Rhodobacterales bacterium HKCCE2091]
MDFVYTARPGRVIFGRGARNRTVDELDRLGLKNVIVITTADQSATAGEFAAKIEGRAGIVYPGAAQHTPTTVTESAMQAVQSVSADGCLAIGGGSTIGLSKAIALRTDLPQVVVPTTFAGSEMTAILGQTEAGKKTTLTDPKVLPETVIYDPDLLDTLPMHIAGPSALNAIAHSVEALYAQETNPIISMMAEESIRALGAAVPVFTSGQGDVAGAYEQGLYGAWLAGTCLGSVGMAIHHKICHTLGGTFDLNHADIHCLMLPYSAAYNREAAPGAMAAVARALDTDDGPAGLYGLTLSAARFKSLKDFGLTEPDLDKAADLAVQNPYYNPRPVSRDGVREMLQAAWEGRKP